MPFYEDSPVDVLAADRRIKELAGNMLRETLSPEEKQETLHEAWRLMASLTPRHEPTAEYKAVSARIEARRAARAEDYFARQRAFEQAAAPKASEGMIANIVSTFKRGLGLGS